MRGGGRLSRSTTLEQKSRKHFARIITNYTKNLKAFLSTNVFWKLKNANENETEILNGNNSCRTEQSTFQNDNTKAAFTLAEVLITLGIIGIVAAMTMPTLIQKHQEKVTVTKLKKAYSTVSQAYLMARNEYGDINYWGFDKNSSFDDTDEQGLSADAYKNFEIFWSKLTPFMSTTSVCIDDTAGKCSISGQYFLNGTNRNKRSSSFIKLKDGSVLMGGWISNINCIQSACGDFSIDINGPQALPNTVGKDVFYFNIYRDKIRPLGSQNVNANERTFDKDCINGGDGYGCAAWVIYNENMEYLHCNDLAWDGKKTCK